jgi:hypothetical protein
VTDQTRGNWQIGAVKDHYPIYRVGVVIVESQIEALDLDVHLVIVGLKLVNAKSAVSPFHRMMVRSEIWGIGSVVALYLLCLHQSVKQVLEKVVVQGRMMVLEQMDSEIANHRLLPGETGDLKDLKMVLGLQDANSRSAQLLSGLLQQLNKTTSGVLR